MKNIIIGLLIILALALTSYSGFERLKPKGQTQENTYSEKNTESSRTGANSENYEISTGSYINNQVIINYPQIRGLGDKEKIINDLIRDEALKGLNYYQGVENEVALEINYNISLKNFDFLSIQYSGVGYVKGAAHPTNHFYTTNIKMNEGEKLRLRDMVEINEELLAVFKSAEYKTPDAANPELEEAVKHLQKGFSNEDLKKYFINADSLDSMGTEEQSDTFSYLKADSLVISISVPHALGDHAEFEMKYSELEDILRVF